MIRHVAVFRFTEETTDAVIDTIDAALATLPGIIPEIVSFTSGRNTHIAEGAWDYAVVSDFATPQDYRTYATNPQHVDMVRNVVGPYVAEAARTQFTIH